MSKPFDVVLRLRLTDPADSEASRRLDALFRQLQETGEGDDITSPDASGRFNLWLQVCAPSLQDALAVAVQRVLDEPTDAGASLIGFELLGAEVQFPDDSLLQASVLAG